MLKSILPSIHPVAAGLAVLVGPTVPAGPTVLAGPATHACPDCPAGLHSSTCFGGSVGFDSSRGSTCLAAAPKFGFFFVLFYV